MNEPLGLKVRHAVADLDREIAQREDGEGGPKGRLLEALQQRAERREFRDLGKI